MKVVNLHLPLGLSSLGDPAYADPCAYGGDESLKGGAVAQLLVLLVAVYLKDHCSHDAHAHVCGGDVVLRALLFYRQEQRTHSYRSLPLQDS